MTADVPRFSPIQFAPQPWIPEIDEVFEVQLQSTGARWYRARWFGSPSGDPSRAFLQPLEPGPLSCDTIIGMRPVTP